MAVDLCLPARASLPATLSLARQAGQWQAGHLLSLLVIRITSNPGEICPPCGIPRRGSRLTAGIAQGKHFTGQAINK